MPPCHSNCCEKRRDIRQLSRFYHNSSMRATAPKTHGPDLASLLSYGDIFDRRHCYIAGMALIDVSDLTKIFRRPQKRPGLLGSFRHLIERRFTDHVAVDHLNLSVERGEAVAYVGPNGAGKSTTVKMLTGILVPTSGDIRVAGLTPHRDRVANARNIGVVFGQRTQLWWDLPVRDSLELLRDMHGIPEARFRRTVERLDAVLKLTEILPSTARRLSLGQRMRADLAAALIHEPAIVYLDEPTIGLDIAVKDQVRAFVKQLIAEGTTVMLTTHDLGDIEDICHRIVILDEGRLLYDGDLQAVKDNYARERTMHFQVATPITDPAALAVRLPGATITRGDSDREIAVTFDRLAIAAGDVLSAVFEHAEVVEVEIDEAAIEHVVRKVYAGELKLAAQRAKEAA